jgi:hypothetical protein
MAGQVLCGGTFAEAAYTDAASVRHPAGRRRCGTPLDPALAAAGYTRHPCCDPGDTELWCARCGYGPALCGCTSPALWVPPARLMTAAGGVPPARPVPRPAAVPAVPSPPAVPPAGVPSVPAVPPAGQAVPPGRLPPVPSPAAGPCPGCGHRLHRDQCGRKAAAGCTPLLDPAGKPFGMACGDKAPCPCPYGWCHRCRTPVVGAAQFPLDDEGLPEIDIDRGSSGDGHWAVRQLADGRLAARRLGAGQQPAEGEWRGREHQCTT